MPLEELDEARQQLIDEAAEALRVQEANDAAIAQAEQQSELEAAHRKARETGETAPSFDRAEAIPQSF